jgi:hypothetical protein
MEIWVCSFLSKKRHMHGPHMQFIGQPPAAGIVGAKAPEDMDEVSQLFQEYAARLGFSLCFQNFSEEPERLLGKYGPLAKR